jgi:hypothetical protein
MTARSGDRRQRLDSHLVTEALESTNTTADGALGLASNAVARGSSCAAFRERARRALSGLSSVSSGRLRSPIVRCRGAHGRHAGRRIGRPGRLLGRRGVLSLLILPPWPSLIVVLVVFSLLHLLPTPYIRQMESGSPCRAGCLLGPADFAKPRATPSAQHGAGSGNPDFSSYAQDN